MGKTVIIEVPKNSWREIGGSVETELASKAVEESSKKDLRAAWSQVRRIKDGALVIEPDTHHARVIRVRDIREPYVIAHPDASQLTDEHLNKYFKSFRSRHGEIADAEEFEEFLDELRDKHGFFLILTVDEPLEFDLETALKEIGE